MTVFLIVMAVVILQRLTELAISARNIRRLMQKGAVEYGEGHYKFIVALHTLFLLSMFAEYFIRHSAGKLGNISVLFLVIFAVLQIVRFWIISSLGENWNTKIVRIPGQPLVKRGPYRFFSHPNYAVVSMEIVFLPMAFGLYYTAAVFTLLNAAVLHVRIKEENKALKI